MDRIIDDDADLDERVVAAVRRRDDVAAAAGQRRATPPLLGESILRGRGAFYVNFFHFFAFYPKRRRCTRRGPRAYAPIHWTEPSRVRPSASFLCTPRTPHKTRRARDRLYCGSPSLERQKSVIQKNIFFSAPTTLELPTAAHRRLTTDLLSGKYKYILQKTQPARSLFLSSLHTARDPRREARGEPHPIPPLSHSTHPHPHIHTAQRQHKALTPPPWGSWRRSRISSWRCALVRPGVGFFYFISSPSRRKDPAQRRSLPLASPSPAPFQVH